MIMSGTVFMKFKKMTVALLCMIVTLTVLFTPVCHSSSDVVLQEKYYFEKANVFVIGRCSNIVTDGSWDGGFYIGKQNHTALGILDTLFERLHIYVFNGSIHKFFYRTTYGGVFMRNVTGIFFWGRSGSGVGLPPITLVRCHAEQVWATI